MTQQLTIGEAVAALGVEERAGEDVAVVRFHNGDALHFTLDQVEENELLADIYVATGRFKAGTITRTSGRKVENLASIFALPIDSDLKDRLGIDKDAVHALSDDDLLAEMTGFLAEIVRVCKATDLQPNYVANTGYGYSLWYMVAPEDQGRVAELRALHKRLVAGLNSAAGWKIADTAASDAGTRIMRIPGSANAKGATPRESLLVHEDGASWTLAALTEAVAAIAPREEEVAAPPVKSYADLPPLDLPASVAGEVAALVAPYWTPGQRHRPALGLAGWLKRNGVSEMQAASIIEECAARAGGDKRDLLAAVRTTYARADNAVAGWTIIRDLLPSGTVDRIDELLSDFWRARNRLAPTPATEVVMSGSGALTDIRDRQQIAASAASAADDEDENRTAIVFPPLPEIVFQGALAEYCDLVLPTTEAPVQFHVGGFLAAVGALAGRVAYTPYASKHVFPNQYVMLVGSTGSSRKDTAIKRATEHFADLALVSQPASGGLVVPTRRRFSKLLDAGSDVALLKHLESQPNTLLVLPELNAQLAKMRRKGAEALFDLIITLWDTNDRYENVTMNNPIVVLNPTLGVLAAIQPARLRAAMSAEILGSGFVNRWLIIPGEAPSPIAEPPDVNLAASRALLGEVTARLDDIATIAGGEPMRVTLSLDCADFWRAYYEQAFHESKRDPDANEIASRYPDLARKVALAYALTDLRRSISPLHIERCHLEAGIAFVKWQAAGTRLLLSEWGGSDETRIEARILAALENHKDDRDEDGSYKVMTNRRLKQLTYIKGVPTSIWNRALASLVKSGDVYDGYPSGTSYVLGREHERRMREEAA